MKKGNYVDQLIAESRSPHAVFQDYVLTASTSPRDTQFLFFEGDDDPVFYISYIISFLGNRKYFEYICYSRSNVLKVFEMIFSSSSSAKNRSLFFIDKDHNNYFLKDKLPSQVFQTEFYSFENYMICLDVFRRYWVERLRLPSTDARYENYCHLFILLHRSFFQRLKILMAIVLIGRGLAGSTPLKLNLNNVAIDRLLKLDLIKQRWRWAPSALEIFLATSNMKASGRTKISGREIRNIVRIYLNDAEPKAFVRGKYELWFMHRFLRLVGTELSAKGSVPRARPTEQINAANCIASLAPLTPLPDDLRCFLIRTLGPGTVGA